jgi:LEA14-like dessication related protein
MPQRLLLISCLVFLGACSQLNDLLKDNVKEPEVSYKSLSVGEFNSQGIELKPVFKVLNKNAFTIPVNNVSYQLSFNQKKMLDGKTGELGNLPANNSKDIALGLLLNKEVLQSFKELLTNNKQLDMQLVGTVNILGFDLPFEASETFYRPEISVADMQVKNASFNQIDLMFSIKIDNKNRFTVPLSDISYRLDSGSKSLASGALQAGSIKQGENLIQVPISIQPSTLFSSVFALFKNPELPLSLVVDSPLQSIKKEQTINLKNFF